MKRFFNFQWFRNTSIAKRLYFTLGIMTLLIVMELVTMFFSLNTTSSVRACIGAESYWSKAQKDAILQLIEYSQSHDEADYEKFQQLMTVILGGHKSLVQLSKHHPDVDLAKRLLIESGIDPDDATGMVNIFRRFHSNLYIAKALVAWTAADSLATQLIPIGERLHTDILSSSASGDVKKVLAILRPLNKDLTVHEDQFSSSLSQGARWLEKIVLKLLFLLVLTVEVTSLLLAITLSRGIQRGLNEIVLSAQAIIKGNFNRKARVYSKDEIGILATVFNKMSEDLQHSAEENDLALRECLKLLGIHGDKIKEALGRPYPRTREQ